MVENFLAFVVFIGCLLVIPRNAEAYLDPGTASFLVQIIIAGVATLALSFKLFWRKIKSKFLFFNRKDDKNEQ
jgi:hypothetical protein